MEAKRFGSKPKRETVSEESPWGITESVGVTGLGGREAGVFDGEVRWDVSGGRWHGGVECGWSGE